MWGGIARATSPPTEGSSILMTSAPRSASWSVPQGPAPNCSTASTRTSASGRTSANRPTGVCHRALGLAPARLIDHRAVADGGAFTCDRRGVEVGKRAFGCGGLVACRAERREARLDLVGMDRPLAGKTEHARSSRGFRETLEVVKGAEW